MSRVEAVETCCTYYQPPDCDLLFLLKWRMYRPRHGCSSPCSFRFRPDHPSKTIHKMQIQGKSICLTLQKKVAELKTGDVRRQYIKQLLVSSATTISGNSQLICFTGSQACFPLASPCPARGQVSPLSLHCQETLHFLLTCVILSWRAITCLVFRLGRTTA